MIKAVCVCIGFISFLPNTQTVAVSDNKSELLKMAEKKIGQLSEAEEKMFKEVAKGEIADRCDKKKENNDPNNADKWGNERVIRGKCVEWLCTDKEAMELVTYKGIQVKGVRIDEKLDLQLIKAPFPLIFAKSAIPKGIDVTLARIQMLSLQGSHVGPINASSIKVEDHIFLWDGFKAEGEVNLVAAEIGGQLNCTNGQFINPDGYAINADILKVDDSVYLCNGFKAEGEVRLLSATIGWHLDCNDGQFINPDGYALNADALAVEGNILLRNGFKAKGKVDLRGADIEGQVSCIGGKFINPNGMAFNGDSVKVEESILLANGFEAEGEVRLTGATIGGQLGCKNAQFINPGRNAIIADSIKVDKHVFLSNQFKAEGKIDFVGAEIGGIFQWHKVDSPEKVMLDLRSAQIGTLYDETKSWPNNGKLLLNGLTYSEIFDESPKDAKTRIEWIRRQYDKENAQFRPQPYEKLAEVLQKSGHENDAKEVLIAKNKDRMKYGKNLTFEEWLWYKFFGPMIGYGHRPLWVFYRGPCGSWFAGSILFWILVGWVLFLVEHRKYPTISTNYNSPKFNSLVYSIDTFVPLVNLYQAKYWLPKRKFFRLYHWVHIAAGWILTTLLVVGLTGLVRSWNTARGPMPENWRGRQ